LQNTLNDLQRAAGILTLLQISSVISIPQNRQFSVFLDFAVGTKFDGK